VLPARFRLTAAVALAAWGVVSVGILQLPRAIAAETLNDVNTLVAAAGVWACLDRARREPAAALGWRTLAAGIGVTAFYQLYPVIAENTLGGVPPFPNLGDWLSLADVPLFAAGMLLWPIGPAHRRQRLRTAIDATLFAVSLLFLVWLAWLGPIARSSDLTPVARAVAAAQFVGPAIALGVVMYQVESNLGLLAGPVGWIAASLLVGAAASLPVTVLSLQGHYYFGHPLDAILLLGLLLFALAPLAPEPVREAVWREPPAGPRTIGLILPLAPGVLAMGAGAWHLAQPGQDADTVLGWLAFAAGALVLLRQYVALRDVEGLSRSLAERVSERTRQLEVSRAAIMQSQRMEAIGRMAGGIAHDFNNLVHAITAWADVLGHSLAHERTATTAVQSVLGLGGQAHELTRRLLAFARRQALTPKLVDLGEVVAESLPMLRRIAGPDIHVEATTRSAMVFADPSHIEQLLSTLTARARDVMPQGGSLAIAVAMADQGFAAGLVHLTVADTGPTMGDAWRAHAFDPFYDGPGAETGLALASCEAIASRAGGRITVAPRGSGGTIFAVELPRASG
jgi:signal transduction histidine kinase